MTRNSQIFHPAETYPYGWPISVTSNGHHFLHSFRKDPQPGQLLYHPNVVLLCWRRTKRLKDILPKKINVACKGDTTPIPRWIDVNINKVKRCQTFQLKIPCTRISAKVALGQFTFFFLFFIKRCIKISRIITIHNKTIKHNHNHHQLKCISQGSHSLTNSCV